MKKKIAFFDFTCCEGCQVELTNLGPEKFAGLLNLVEFVEFREIMSKKTEEMIDIAFIEGSFTREKDRERLIKIRERAKIVVAYGSCATLGGINALKHQKDGWKEFVYGNANFEILDSSKALPISSVIKVDYNLHGCPINREEFLRVAIDLAMDKEPLIPNYPVCVQCKVNETICRYLLNECCLGLVARAGCGAPCPKDGIPCEACRGFVDNPNLEALKEVIKDEKLKEKLYLFTSNQMEEKNGK